MPIKVFYFIAPMNDWMPVVREQGAILRASGLAEAAEEIHIAFAGRPRQARALDIASLVHPKAKLSYFSRLDQYEFPAMHMLYHNTRPCDRVLYIHTKGVSHRQPWRKGADEWRRYMMWGCVERWRECVQALEGHDIAGVQWTRLDAQYAAICGAPEVFAGNFWWARGQYIADIGACEFSGTRFQAEGWIARGKPRVADLHNLTGGEAVRAGKHPTGPNVPGFGRHSYTSDPLPVEAGDLDAEYAREWPIRCRTDLLNRLIERRGYRKYLEIGTYDGRNIRAIKAPEKTGVDPDQKAGGVTHRMTSDEFFCELRRGWDDERADTLPTFDLIFIDGLHTAEQVSVDIDNALAHLARGGAIVCHDMQPETEWEQRDLPGGYDGRGMWLGTCWRAWAALRMKRPDLSMRVVDVDCGCGIIERGRQDCYPLTPISWPLYVRDRARLLNTVSARAFVEGIR